MDKNLLDLKANTTVQGDMSSLNKLTQSYMLLKKRICGTHEVIKQYNDKLKECEKLKQDLESSTKQTKKVTCNYNSTLAKVIKLELQNTEYKKNIQTLTTQVNEHAIKAAADQQHIQQLICKIKDVEGCQNDKIMQYDLEKSSLQVKVKELEQELKNIKKSHDVKPRKKEKKLPIENENKTKLTDVGTNTMLTTDIIIQKPQVLEKSTLTDEFYNIKEDLYPIFCAKCETRLEPAPLEEICKIMTNSCPKLIEKISSPQKRAPSPIPVPTSLNNEQCKTEDSPILSDTPPPHLQNQNNRTDFIPTNLLPASLNRTNYCSTFPPESNLINQSAYYIGSAPINHLPMTNSNATNQNNHCENVATMASSLSIISSLQKRIDTLETKVRKKLSKKKSEQNNSCCQHYHPNAWQMYDMNNSMQFNFMELWKKMANFYEDKERNDFNAHKKSRKCKLSRLKLATKRLQSTRTGSWKVESVPRNIEQNPLRKKHKKSKYRYSAHLSKSEAFLNSIESIEQLDSDSDVNSSIDTFNDSGDSKMNITLMSEEVIPRIEVTTSQSNKTNMNETDDIQIVRNSAESIKSTGGETDSGILSDSVESGKLLQLDVDMDVSSELKEHQNTSDTRNTSEEIESCMNKDIRLQKSSIKVASNLMKRNKLSEANVTSKLIQRTDEYLEEIEHRQISEISQPDSVAPEVRTDTPGTPNINKKRKINELDLKKSGNRQDLLRKLKKLKKNKTPVTKLQNVSEHRDVQNDENENFNFPQKQMDTSYNLGMIKDNVYVPKKKPRIAHVPKIATFEENKSIRNSLQFKKHLVKNIEHTIPQDTNYNCIALHESTKDDNESEIMCNDRTEEIRTTTSSTENSTHQTIVEHKINKIPMSEVAHTNSLDVDVNNHNHSDIKSDVKHFSHGRLEHNETKTEFSNRNERSGHGQGNNLLDISITCEVNNPDQRDNGDSIKIPEENNADETNFNTEETNKNTRTTEDNFSTEHKLKLHCPLTRLQRHITDNKCQSKNCQNKHKELSRIHLIADKFVKKQLQRLIDSDWENPVHRDVIEKLASTCSARIIAKGIVNFLCSEQECTEGLDNSHTPPAPLMTKSQQRIVALLVDLEEAKPTVFQFVQAGIEYRLFRLNQTTERTVIESLSRMYTVLARIKKDREKVRMFCCDALYCLGLHAIIILYTVFTCWPEIFPNNEANKLLPKCMAHLVMTQQATDYPKLFALKNLLSVFYKYPMGTLSKDLLTELLMTFKENSYTEVETAIILLAKREGTAWTYKNIIRGALLPMIIDNKIPNTYAAFCLLGNLLRVFPIEDKDNSVGGIVEQLCDLINSGEGPDEQKEGVVSALLSLSRHQFDAVVKNTLKWTPSAPLHDRTIEQMNGLFNCRTVEFWKGYLTRNKQLLNMQRTS